jgi:hypothetical protein
VPLRRDHGGVEENCSVNAAVRKQASEKTFAVVEVNKVLLENRLKSVEVKRPAKIESNNGGVGE